MRLVHRAHPWLTLLRPQSRVTCAKGTGDFASNNQVRVIVQVELETLFIFYWDQNICQLHQINDYKKRTLKTLLTYLVLHSRGHPLQMRRLLECEPDRSKVLGSLIAEESGSVDFGLILRSLPHFLQLLEAIVEAFMLRIFELASPETSFRIASCGGHTQITINLIPFSHNKILFII